MTTIHNTLDVRCIQRDADSSSRPDAVCFACSEARHPSALTGVVAPPEGYPDWFHAWVDANAPTIAAKAEEYGTNSLVEMGRIFARGQGREIEEREAVELGCFLYAYGKMQRVADAALKGRTPSFDTWSDLLVYSSMAMYARETGRWP